MTEEIKIILIRASWCPHCNNFEPIYKEAEKLYKTHDELNKYVIKFDNFDMADDKIKNTFALNHYEIMKEINGYPSVFVIFKKSDTNIKNNYAQINHTVIDENIDKKQQIEEATKRFLENIINCIKTFNSNGKITYLQEGGNFNNSKYDLNNSDNINKNIDIYKKKYLKYKSKYLKLKKNIKIFFLYID